MSEQSLVTAAILVIGDEILSGRTKDKNIGYLAEYLTAVGIDVREVRVVPDIEAEIVEAATVLSGRYTYLFTTGGIGPTHDDITADCIAKAVGVGIDIDERAVALGTLGALHCRGVRVAWDRACAADGVVVPLPPYPWERERFAAAGKARESLC